MGLEATIAVVVLCLFLQAFFAGSEIALISCDKIRMKVLAGRGLRSARLVLKSHSQVERFLSTTLAGINLSLITSTILLSFHIERRYGGGGELYPVLILSPLVVVFGQVVPKSIFRKRSDSAILWMIYPLWATAKILSPLTWAVGFFTRLALRIAGHRSSITRGEILDSIKAHATGDTGDAKRRMLGRIFSFSEVTVGEVMIPLDSVKSLESRASPSAATELIRASGHSRIPLCDGTPDNITGVLHSFLLLDSSAHPQAQAGAYSSPAFYVSRKKPINELLDEMKAGPAMAVVVDENKRAVGIVTLEDILEEIVGEIEDEHDIGERLWTRTGPKRYLVSPQVRVETINEELGISIPERDDYETLGGFLLSEFGRIPSEGETLETAGLIFTVQSATSRSIEKVQIAS